MKGKERKAKERKGKEKERKENVTKYFSILSSRGMGRRVVLAYPRLRVRSNDSAHEKTSTRKFGGRGWDILGGGRPRRVSAPGIRAVGVAGWI